jgi:hypothetical protein
MGGRASETTTMARKRAFTIPMEGDYRLNSAPVKSRLGEAFR